MCLLFVRCLSNQSQHFVAYKALLMLRSRDPPEKLTVLQWLKKMTACYGTQCFLPQSMPVYRMYWQSTSILPSCLHLGFPVGLFSSLYLKPSCISVPPFPWPYVTRVPCPFHHPSFYCPSSVRSGPGISVGIVTDYRLDGQGLNPSGDEIFCPSKRPWGPPNPL